MTVLVIGATGFMGPSVARRLAARGEDVVAVHRGGRPAALPHGIEVRAADRNDPVAIRSVVRQTGATVVVDMIAYTEASTRLLLDALAGKIERYVLVSSCDVYRNYGGLLRREAAAPIPVLSEDSPLRESRYPRRQKQAGAAPSSRAFQDEYDKIPVEQAALSHPGFAATVLRLPMVFGPGDHQRRFAWAVWRIAEGSAVIRMQPAIADWRSTFGYIEDVAEAIALAALHPAAAGRTYNVGRSDAPTQAEWAERIAAAMGHPVRIEHSAVGGALSGLAADLDLSFPLATDTSRIRAELGFAEVATEADALQATIADELGRGRPAELDAEEREHRPRPEARGPR